MALLNWKSVKRKSTLDNTSLEVETLHKVIETLQESNEHFKQVNQQREDLIIKLRSDLTALQADFSLATSYICENCNCKYRSPIRGQGTDWIAKLKSGEASPNYNDISDGRGD